MTYCRCAGSQDECHNSLTKKYDDDTSDDNETGVADLDIDHLES